jgi:hypothetical protein
VGVDGVAAAVDDPVMMKPAEGDQVFGIGRTTLCGGDHVMDLETV